MTLIVGDIIYLNPNAIPDLVIITKEEADAIANASPRKMFVITGPDKEEFKDYTDYVRRHRK